MTQEQKELLIKDLCTRLPYRVKCNVWYGPKSPALNEKDKYSDDILETINPKKGNCTFHNAIGYDFGFFPVEYVKPYLRPMSSMTEEEKRELERLIDKKLNKHIDQEDDEWTPWVLHDTTGIKNYVGGERFYFDEMSFIYDWLNAHHFDYRGLIEKGLALEAPEGMYNI